MRRRWWCAAILATAIAGLPVVAAADQSSQPSSAVAGHLSTGGHHTCVVLTAALHCWGFGGDGRLGYGGFDSVGDDEAPGAAGQVGVGTGRSVRAISAGAAHTCAVLDDGSVRCWGFGGDGRLGYGSTASVADASTAGPVNVGAGRTATAISAGGDHTCAILDDGTVRCWGYGFDGQLGYGSADRVGDDETPGSVEPVSLGAGRTATAITAGADHTCAILDDGSVRCWGFGENGQLGYANTLTIGNDEKPDTVAPVNLGTGRTALAISAGGDHTCVVLDDASVRCWGTSENGQLGYGSIATIGDDESPGAVGPVNLGAGRTALAIAAGGRHSCAILDDASVRCWGSGGFGQLGYASTSSVGAEQTPATVGPVDLGGGRSARAVDAGEFHSCALLDDASVRCWGYGANGRLGYCNQANVGDNELPGSRGPVDLGTSGAGCAVAPPPPPPPLPPVAPPAMPAAPPPPPVTSAASVAFAREAARAQRLRRCLASAARKPRSARRRARLICVQVHGRRPARVRLLRARAVSRTSVVLTFEAPGSDQRIAPAARAYLVKQSRRPLRRQRDFESASALCRGSCRFPKDIAVGAKLSLTVTDLQPRTRYYYAVAARDNVSHRTGRRSRAVAVRTR